MTTYVAYDNPMGALSRRYAVYRAGEVVDRLSTKQAALRRAIQFCEKNLPERLAMCPATWPNVVARAVADQQSAEQLKAELTKEQQK